MNLTAQEEKETYQSAYDELYETCQKTLFTAGYRIYTSIDLEKQKVLQQSIDEALAGFTDLNDEGVFKLRRHVSASTMIPDTCRRLSGAEVRILTDIL